MSVKSVGRSDLRLVRTVLAQRLKQIKLLCIVMLPNKTFVKFGKICTYTNN